MERKIHQAFLSLAGIGFLPAGGTWASAVTAVGIYAANEMFARGFYVFTLTVLCAFCLLSYFGRDAASDPSWVVLDEAAGVSIALLGVRREWPWFVAAFVLFRFFDIVKPLGLRRLEKIASPLAILWDDLGAGVYTWIILTAAAYFLP